MNNKTKTLIERFEEKFGKNYIVKSEPEDYIHKSVDNSYYISGYKKWLTQEINQLVEEEREKTKQETLLYLLQRFNDYEVPISMSAEDVRELLNQFMEEYKI